jgi:hypothetical protein
MPLKLHHTLDCQTEPQLSKANKSWVDSLENLQKKGAVFRGLHFSTTTEQVRVKGWADVAGPAQPLAKPLEVTGNPFLALRVHQTLADHMFQVQLAGKELSSTEIEKQTMNARQPAIRLEWLAEAHSWITTSASKS